MSVKLKLCQSIDTIEEEWQSISGNSGSSVILENERLELGD